MPKLLFDNVKGQVFASTNKSQEECFKRQLFGTSKLYGAAAFRVQKGDFLFLLNLDSYVLYGVFKAVSDAGARADGSYVMSEKPIEESEKVKTFDKFVDDLKELINSSK
jgi:hypothetical protein